MNKLQKTLALVLCVAVCLCGGGMSLRATSAVNRSEDSAKSAQPTGDGQTVYVLSDADGAVEKVYVSDESESLAAGREEALPVTLRVSYTLDGKAISAKKLAGQSGHVTIRFDYENRAYETVEIDGKRERIYVPFVLVTGLMLDSDLFCNVTATNGRVVDDGDHTIVMGLALSGLREDLALDGKTPDIPEYVQIEADVTDFALGMTVTLATCEPFGKLDETRLDAVDDASASLGELTEAMDALMEGADALYNGLCTLLDSTGELTEGVASLAAGALEVQGGAYSLQSGAAEASSGASELSSGLSTLSAESAGLNSGAASVFDALLSTANTQLAASGLSVSTLTVGNYASVLGALIDSLDETAVYNAAYAQVSAAVEAQRGAIEEAVTAAVREQVRSGVESAARGQVNEAVNAAVRESVTTQVLASLGMTQELYDAADEETRVAVEAAVAEQMVSEAVQGQIAEAVSAQMQSEETQTLIAQNLEAQMASEDIQATIAQNVEAQVQQAIADNMASDAVQSQLSAASEGARSVIALKISLDSYNAFYLGLAAYTGGVDQAASGAASLVSGLNELSAGAGELATGAGELRSGAVTLNDSMPTLTAGVTGLRDGAEALRDGLEELDEQVVEKVVKFFQENMDGLTDRLRATVEAARGYTGVNGDGSSAAKFIYRTGEIE